MCSQMREWDSRRRLGVMDSPRHCHVCIVSMRTIMYIRPSHDTHIDAPRVGAFADQYKRPKLPCLW